jgi:hypothetical protein
VTDTITIGTIMVQDSTPMPKSLIGAQSYSGGWSVVANPNRSQLGRELESSSWTVSNTTGEMATTGLRSQSADLDAQGSRASDQDCQIMGF